MKKAIAVLLLGMVFTMAMAFSTSVHAPPTYINWPMFHHDLALSGVSPSTAPNTNNTLWIYDTRSSVLSSPAIVDGILYIGAMDGRLYALDADTGALIWFYQTGGAIYSSPAVEYDKVYFLSTDGKIYALDADTGAFIWSTAIGPGSLDWSSPAVHGGRVFIAGSRWVHSLNANTGAFIWSTNVGGQSNGPIAVVNGKVYSGTHNFDNLSPTLVALDELTGGIIWTYDYHLWHGGVVAFINSNGAAVADGDGDGDLEVYFGVVTWTGSGPQAICLDEATGAEVWTQNINGWSTSTPAVHNGVVFIGSDDHNLYALNAGTGAVVWTYTTGAAIWAAPAVADGKVFVGSLDHIFYALNEVTGSLIWSYDTSLSRLIGSPAVADGKVFVGNENGKVYAFGQPYIPVYVDIKPGSWPNPLNLKDKGVLPVAVCGTEDFDVTTIDPATVQLTLEGLGVGVSPLRWSYEDVATPYLGEDYGGHDLDGDGYLDLTLKFKAQEVIETLGLDAFSDGDVVTIVLTGNLKEEYDGTAIIGQDYIIILSK